MDPSCNKNHYKKEGFLTQFSSQDSLSNLSSICSVSCCCIIILLLILALFSRQR